MASKYGFIDKSGKVVIEPQFRDAEPCLSPSFHSPTYLFPFSEGFAMVAIEVEGGREMLKL